MLLALVAFAAGATFGAGVLVGTRLGVRTVVIQRTVLDSRGALAVDAIRRIAAQASPSVVKISTVRRIEVAPSSHPLYGGPFYPFASAPPAQSELQTGIGSGFVVALRGIILTNDHVIQGAERILVTGAGIPRPLVARVVGADDLLDLAVLRVRSARPLRPLPLASPRPPQVGDWVVAIGNPYGLADTVTEGVISAEGRPLVVDGRRYRNLLQTNAAINPGNSGGPLLDLKGRVVGVNTATAAVGQGIGFAIPTSTVVSALSQLIRTGHVAHAWLGIVAATLTPDVARILGVAPRSGVEVVARWPRSPAAVAGIRPGEVILSLGGQRVHSQSQLAKVIASLAPGARVRLTVLDRTARHRVTVRLGQRPPDLGPAQS